MAKVQSQLLVPEYVRDQADALALALGETRAEVYRKALAAALPVLEGEHAALLAKVDAVAVGMNMTRLELAAKAARDGYTLADLEGRKRYPAARKA